jgi:hypothetical protein
MTAGKKRKTFEIPDPPEPRDQAPVFIFDGLDRDRRDTSKPIAFDEHGNPLYAPRGLTLRWPRTSGVDLPIGVGLVGRRARG